MVKRGVNMKFFNVLHNVILNPLAFFKKIKSIRTIHQALVFFLIFASYVSIFSTIAGWSAFKTLFPKLFVVESLTIANYVGVFSSLYYAFSIFQSVAVIMILTTIFYLMLHLVVKKIKFAQVFNILAFSYAPAFILTPIILLLQAVYYQYLFAPLLWVSMITGIALAIWMINLQVTGVHVFAKIPKMRALIAMYIIPLLFLLLLSSFLIFYSTWFGVLPLAKFA